MFLPIIYPSAAEFWLDGTNRKRIDHFSLNKRSNSTLDSSFNFKINTEICHKITQMMALSEPLYLMAPTAQMRRHGNSFVCKSIPSDLIADCFIKVGYISTAKLLDKTDLLDEQNVQLYVSSPEMCFLEAASVLEVPELIELGYKLCARYIIDRNKKFLQRNREILTTRQKISEFLDRAANCYGIKKARRAIKYVIDNSNSPIETKIAIIISLPCSMGGYGLGMMELNETVELSKKAADLIGRDYLMCDLLFRIAKVIVEYDSNICHLYSDQHSYDKKRILALELSDFKVLNMTSKNLNSLDDLDMEMDVLRSLLGQRSNKTVLNKYRDKREKLFECLFKNNKEWQ